MAIRINGLRMNFRGGQHAAATFLYSAEFNPSQSFITFQPNGLSMDNETSFI